jgi:hypothetical protein
MKWYRDYYSGVGRATYSAYDESAQTLWIYEYSCQHDILWSSGDVPAGEHFSTSPKKGHDLQSGEPSENDE